MLLYMGAFSRIVVQIKRSYVLTWSQFHIERALVQKLKGFCSSLFIALILGMYP